MSRSSRDLGMAIERVVVEVHLRVEREEAAVGRGDERIDFDQRRIGIFGSSRQRHHELDRSVDELGFEPQPESDLARLERQQAVAGNEVNFDDGVGIFGCDFFDLHAAGRRCHEDVAPDLTVEHDAEVHLAGDGQRLFNQQPLHFLAFGAGLVGDQIHAQHLRNQRRSFFGVHGDLHAAALTAATSMNLRLNDYTCGALAQQ